MKSKSTLSVFTLILITGLLVSWLPITPFAAAAPVEPLAPDAAGPGVREATLRSGGLLADRGRQRHHDGGRLRQWEYWHIIRQHNVDNRQIWKHGKGAPF